MHKIFVFVTIVLFLSTSLFGAGQGRQIIEIKFDKMTSEVQQTFRKLGLDILHHDPVTRTARVLVSADEFHQIESLGISPITLIPDADVFATTLFETGYLDNFYSYPEILADLNALQTQFPNLISVSDFGDSYLKTVGKEGYDLLAVKISDNVTIDESEPEVLIFANMHAREMITTEIVMHFIHELLDGYSQDPYLKQLVDEREIWLIPTLNPDGHQYVLSEPTAGRVTMPMWWRKNLHDNDGDGVNASNYDGVDINRNFGFKWGHNSEGSSPLLTALDYRGQAPFSEPETKAFRQFVIQHEFLLSVDLHSSGQYIFYPWGYRADIETDHHAALKALADSCAAYNGYRAEMASMLYPVNGGADDWLYGDVAAKKRVFPFTFEVGNVAESLDPGGFYPKPEFFQKQITDNIKPLLFMIDAAGQMPAINVVPIPDYEERQLSYVTRIQLTPAVELTEPIQLDENGLWVYFKKTDTAPFDSVQLEKTENQGEYAATISGMGDANSVSYFYKITDSRGLTRRSPRTAPEKLFEYTIKTDTVPPVVSSEPIPDIPFTTEHVEFCVNAEDNIGIDRVLAHISLNGRAIESFEMMAADTTVYKHVWDYSAFTVGDIIEYYFEVWDAAKKQNYTRFPETDYLQICVANQQLFDLEGNWGLIAQASGDWQHGAPKSGPGEAISGEAVWATNLSGNYTKNTKSSLITQSIDLKDTRQARVTFWQWFSFEAENTARPVNGYDGGNILISVDNGPFEIIEPENGYNMTLFSGASGYDHSPVFSGQYTGNFWHQCTLNLTENVGHQVRLRFDATSDQQFTCPGWYLDDFKLILSSNMPPMLTNVTRMPKKTPNNGPTLISATVIDDRTVMDVTLHYTTDRISEFRQVKMKIVDGADNSYCAEIPKQKFETDVKYYLTATDSDGLTTFWPTGAPKKCIRFEITSDLPQIDMVFDLILHSDSPQLPDADTLLIVNNGQQPLVCTVSETLFTVTGETEFDQIGSRSVTIARPVKLFSVFPREFSLNPADTICVSVKRAALAVTDKYSGALLLKSNDPVNPVLTVPFAIESSNSAAPDNNSLPICYSLDQNYPNPFNPETTISFHLPTAGFVKMQVYNARGQLIQTLLESDLPAGSHQQNWRAETADGVSLASGLYFVRISAGDFAATRKMLLLR